MRDFFILTGKNLDIETLGELAHDVSKAVSTCPDGQKKLIEARQVVEQIIQQKKPVYGITTGLGSKVTELLSEEELVSFSYQTIRGRAHSLGDPLPESVVRAAMIIRLNSMMLGASGASPELAIFLSEVINRNLIPVIGNIGSIGASDLCWGASMALSFIGEGEMLGANDEHLPADSVLSKSGLLPLKLKPKDGLVLSNHSSFSSALAALAAGQCKQYLHNANCAAAMSMQIMRANLSPLDEFVVEISADCGASTVAKAIRSLLLDSELNNLDLARKIQDPLSIRNTVQVHGTLQTALDFAIPLINQQLNASTDNPVVDIEKNRVVSSGGYYSSQLTLATETLGRALEQVIVTQLARISKILSQRHSGLPQFLALPEANSNAFAPTLKLAESLVAEIKKTLAAVDYWPSINAEGVEDIQNHAPLSAKSLTHALHLSEKLCAMELIMACQGADLTDRNSTLPAALFSIYKRVRSIVPVLQQDRPMGKEIEMLAELIQGYQMDC